MKEEKDYERIEREEMARQLQSVMVENRRLREQATGIFPLLKSKEEEEDARRRQVNQLFEENRLLKTQLQRLMTAHAEAKEDDGLFATPNGSADPEVLPSQEAEAPEDPEDPEVPGPEPEKSGKGKGGKKVKEANGGGGETLPPQTLEIILKLMQGMQDIQKKLAKPSHKEDETVQEVIQRGVELPRLPEWSPETGPIDFSDWMLVLAPLMGDLSTNSEEWWQSTVETAKSWYLSHMSKSPMERLHHQPSSPPTLTQKRWARLERRASSLLLAAIPEGLKEEVVSSRSLTTLGILTKGMILYQPGGLAEKSAILVALESPQEAQTLAGGVSILRRWLRWKRRGEELGVSIPDATQLVKGLSKMMKKLSATNADLKFRLQLARNQLMVDTVPTQESVTKYSEHLLAELEQMGHQTKKKEAMIDLPKAKKFEEQAFREKKDWKETREGDEKEKEQEKGKCRFFLSESGCRRGKSCGFSHEQRDDDELE